MYNLWRATTPPPQDFPLAVCDARSLTRHDEVTVKAITEERSGEILHDTTGYLYNPAHRWHYFRDMTAGRGPRVQGPRHRPPARRSRSPHGLHRPHLPARAFPRGRAWRCAGSRSSTETREDPPVAALTVDEVVERAQALTDVEDPDPTHFVENLEAVVGSMNDEAALTPEGVEANVGMLAVALRNRIEVDRYVADEPGVDASPIARPIFLTGLPRSGTTYFQYLFDQEPDLRMLRTWEGERPVPPPATDADSVRRRHEASVENARRTHAATGGKIDAFHLTDVDGPQECLAILDQTFVNPGLLWTMSVVGLPRVPVARGRPHRGLRVPRPGAATPAVGRARTPVDAEVAVPPPRARCDRERASGRSVRGDPSRSRAGAGLELQLDPHAQGGDLPERAIRTRSGATCWSSCASTSTGWWSSTSPRRRRAPPGSCTSTTTDSSTRRRR